MLMRWLRGKIMSNPPRCLSIEDLKSFMLDFIFDLNQNKNTETFIDKSVSSIVTITLNNLNKGKTLKKYSQTTNMVFSPLDTNEKIYELGCSICASERFEKNSMLAACTYMKPITPPKEYDKNYRYYNLSVATWEGDMLSATTIYDHSKDSFYVVSDSYYSIESGTNMNSAGCFISGWFTSLIMRPNQKEYGSIMSVIISKLTDTYNILKPGVGVTVH